MIVITLIADPNTSPLTQGVADSMAAALAAQGIPVEKTAWRAKDTAIDFYLFSSVQGKSIEDIDAAAQAAIGGQALDAIVQPIKGCEKKLLIADMESTVITVECLDELADYVGLKDKIAAITARAMNGELDFAAALTERVALLKGLPESALQEVMDKKVRLTPGARELVATMKKHGAYTMLVSGGFTFYTERVKSMLGFDEARGNTLEIAQGKLTGRVIPPILGKEAKLQALQDGCRKLGITPNEVLAVGDGANDLPMLLVAGLGVAYHAKPAVRAKAGARINHGDLTALLFAQGYVPTSSPRPSAG